MFLHGVVSLFATAKTKFYTNLKFFLLYKKKDGVAVLTDGVYSPERTTYASYLSCTRLLPLPAVFFFAQLSLATLCGALLRSCVRLLLLRGRARGEKLRDEAARAGFAECLS